MMLAFITIASLGLNYYFIRGKLKRWNAARKKAKAITSPARALLRAIGKKNGAK